MKKLFFFAASAAALLAVSCAKETPATVSDNGKQTLTISLGAGEKSYMNYAGKTFWAKGDEITVISDKFNSEVFTATVTSGKATSDFTCDSWTTGDVPEYAVYCYGDNQASIYDVVSTEAGKFSAIVSDYQKSTARNSFGSRANLSVAKLSPVEDTFEGTMLNVTGLVKIPVNIAADIREITLADANGTASIAGTVEINYNEGDPVCTVKEGKSSITTKAYIGTSQVNFDDITSKANDGSTLYNEYVYISVIPGVSFVPQITYETEDGASVTFTGNKAITVERNKFVEMPIESLEYKTFTLDLNFSEKGESGSFVWPFNETVLSSGNQRKQPNFQCTYTTKNGSYPITLGSGTTILSGQTGQGTYAFSAGYIKWYNSCDGKQFIGIGCLENQEIEYVQMAFIKSKSVTGVNYVATSMDELEIVEEYTCTSPNEDTPKTHKFVLTGKKAAKGCKIKMTDSAKAYWLAGLQVKYRIPVKDE